MTLEVGTCAKFLAAVTDLVAHRDPPVRRSSRAAALPPPDREDRADPGDAVECVTVTCSKGSGGPMIQLQYLRIRRLAAPTKTAD